MSVEIVLGGFAIAFFKLVVGLVLSICSVYLGIGLLDRMTPNIDEWREIKKGNFAVGLLLGGVVLSIAIIIESGVSSALDTILPGVAFPLMLMSLLVAAIQLLIGVIAAVFSVYIAISIINKVTPDLDEINELKKGNVAVATVMATIMFAIAFVIKSAVDTMMGVVDLSLISNMLGVG